MTAVATAPRKATLRGHTEPRLFTPPLRKLTRKTTLGFECIDFAKETLGIKLLPWQKWWLKHALELKRDGSFRYRTIITLVARQNGKTTLMIVLALFLMSTGRADLVLGSAQSLDIAREAWQGSVDLATDSDELSADLKVRHTNGEQCMWLANGSRYRITAATRSAGRGLSVDVLLLDELREHRDWAAWGALSKTIAARPNALVLGFSNAGDDQSVVLNSLRAAALAGKDDTLGLLEWSAPDGCELDDRDAWADANPALGHTITEASLESSLSIDPPNVFRTESLCQRVDALDSAVDTGAWKSSADERMTLDGYRDRVAACVDVAPDGSHVSLAVAAMGDDGRARVEIAGAWKSTADARKELGELLDRVQPRAVAWFPVGPASALAPDLRPRSTHEIRGADVVEACMAFADMVASGLILHNNDPLLTAHISGATKLPSGDGWRFARRGVGNVDAAYAAAGAVKAAQNLPAEEKKPRSRIF